MIFKLALLILLNLVYGAYNKHIKNKRNSACINEASELSSVSNLDIMKNSSKNMILMKILDFEIVLT